MKCPSQPSHPTPNYYNLNPIQPHNPNPTTHHPTLRRRLRALGTVAQLASSAGRHYLLRVAFAPAERERVAADVLRVTPHAERVRLFDGMGTWRIAKRDDCGQQWRFSALYRALRANERVRDFSLTDVGLTEVFESIVLSKDDKC